jgi:hypothetical protein
MTPGERLLERHRLRQENARRPETLAGYLAKLRSSPSGKAEREEYLDSAIDKVLGPIYEMLGEELILVPDDLGTKCPRYGIRSVASHLTRENLPANYWEKIKESVLEGGNLAVKVGPDSGNIVTLDIDHDSVVEPFLEINERLLGTLRTTGSGVGCNFWFRLVGRYVAETVVIHVTERLAKKHGLKANSITGTFDIGEYRKGGGQKTTIFGMHPSGKGYEWLVSEPVVTLAESELFFPRGWNWRSRTPLEIDAAKRDRVISEDDLINATADRRANRKFYTGGSH